MVGMVRKGWFLLENVGVKSLELSDWISGTRIKEEPRIALRFLPGQSGRLVAPLTENRRGRVADLE